MSETFSVSMTYREYQAVAAALEAVFNDGERRTRFSDWDKATTKVFGEALESIVSRNGDPWMYEEESQNG